MRILFFSRDYTTHDRRFLCKLSETEHEIFYLRLEDRRIGYEPQPLPENIRLVDWPGGRDPRPSPSSWLALVPSLEKVLADVQPDLVHAGPVPSCGFMTALTGFRPLITMSWGSDILYDAEHDTLLRWMTKFALERSDGLVCDCRAVADKAFEIAGCGAPQAVQFPWGLELREYRPGKHRQEARTELDVADNFVVLSPRSWEPIYGIETLLSAFALAYSRDSRLRLMMPGSGSLAPKVESFIEQNGLSQVVHCPGMLSREQLLKALAASDLYVSCALSDGSSISLLEAMAMQVLPVVSDLPANREWLRDRRNGWLVPASDARGFASAILDATNTSVDRRASVSKRNRKIIEELADWDKNFPKLLLCYEELFRSYASPPMSRPTRALPHETTLRNL